MRELEADARNVRAKLDLTSQAVRNLQILSEKQNSGTASRKGNTAELRRRIRQLKYDGDSDTRRTRHQVRALKRPTPKRNQSTVQEEILAKTARQLEQLEEVRRIVGNPQGPHKKRRRY